MQKITQSIDAILYRLLDGRYWLIKANGLRLYLTETEAQN